MATNESRPRIICFLRKRDKKKGKNSVPKSEYNPLFGGLLIRPRDRTYTRTCESVRGAIRYTKIQLWAGHEWLCNGHAFTAIPAHDAPEEEGKKMNYAQARGIHQKSPRNNRNEFVSGFLPRARRFRQSRVHSSTSRRSIRNAPRLIKGRKPLFSSKKRVIILGLTVSGHAQP